MIPGGCHRVVVFDKGVLTGGAPSAKYGPDSEPLLGLVGADVDHHFASHTVRFGDAPDNKIHL
jgi:hypothetical protein